MPRSRPRVAFVLGGGGTNGASEVGMLRALLEGGVIPDLVVGTSVGALNGAAVAAEPTVESAMRLQEVWLHLDHRQVFGGSIIAGATGLFRNRTHLHSNTALRRLIKSALPVSTFEELAVRFQCVAASIERAGEHWFEAGSLVDAILASSAVPGVLPPIQIGGEHFVDGGIVNSIPISRAVELGAREIYVLQVGRIESPLKPPKTPLEVGLVAFEIARRHRFTRDLTNLPRGSILHVLPTGDPKRPNISQLNYRDLKGIGRRIERAYEATRKYLASPNPVGADG